MDVVEGEFTQHWQWLESLVNTPWWQELSAETKHQFIAQQWPEAIQLHSDSAMNWQSVPTEAWFIFPELRQSLINCSQLKEIPWLSGGQNFYRVLIWQGDSSAQGCAASLLPVLGKVTAPLKPDSNTGWLLLSPTGQQLSAGHTAALVALKNKHRIHQSSESVLFHQSSDGQKYALMQFKLFGLTEPASSLVYIVAQPLSDFLIVDRLPTETRIFWWCVWLLGILIISIIYAFWRRLIKAGFSTDQLRKNNVSGTNRLEIALESSQSGYWEWNIASGQVDFSNHWISMLGLNKEKIAKNGIDEWLHRIHPDDRSRSKALLVTHLKGQTGMFEDEQRVLNHEGDYLWFLTRGKVTERNPDGFATHMLGVYTLIDDHKRVEALALKQQKALGRLNEIATLTGSDSWERLRESLSLGAEYLELPFGIISHIVGNSYTVKIQHSPPNTLKDGEIYHLPDCYCHDTLKSGDVFAVHHIKNSAYSSHPCYINSQLECYIGAPVWVAGNIYGTINFSSSVARQKSFSDTERDFVRLLAKWVGSTLEHWLHTREIIELSDTFTKLSDSLPGCLCQFQMNADGKLFFPFASRGINDIFGVTPGLAAHSADLILNRIHKDDIAHVNFSIEESARSMTLWRECYRYNHPERGIIWVRSQTSPEKLTNGSIIWHGYIWEVTDEMRAEENLKHANRWRQATLDAASVSFIATDYNGIIKTFNKGAEALLGYRADELIDKCDPGCLHLGEEVVARAQVLSDELGYSVKPGFDVFVEKVKYGGTEENNWTYVRKDGSHFPIVLTVTAIFDEHGKVDGYLGVGRDVSEVQEQKERLRAFAERTQTILNNAADGIIVIRKNGIIDTFNKSAERLFGWKADEIIGQSINLLMPKEIAAEHDQYLARGRDGRVDRVLGQSRSLVGLRRDGEQFPLEIALSEIEQDGEPFYIAMLRDITERQRIDRMKSDFIATVSHELRTPLTAISGSLRLLDGGALGRLEGQVERLVRIAYANSARLIDLVNDLLDMEKLVSGKVEFVMTQLDIVPLIKSALEETASYAAEYQVNFELEDHLAVATGDAGQILVTVDANRLKQVMVNLLSNAAKFSPSGSTVTVSLQWQSGFVEVSVIDQGIGIAEKFHDQIFQKFSQVDSSSTRSKGGTGLGLAISKELVTHMGGEIGFESAPKQGSRFYFTLPGELK
ncbi:PAS domain S-box protein [Gilvimarinus agarilyticus]|nr:PAS domain S-box protein [Gilvimarinus agarilyticus]